MAQSVIPKKEEKVLAVFETMEDKADFDEFQDKFKKMYPADWERIVKRYNDHERKDTKGKGHPMPQPDKYLSNMYKTYYLKLYK
jgi:hypothetical protein